MNASGPAAATSDQLPVPLEPWDAAVADDVIRQAARRYIDGCRARIDPFVDRHFSFNGSLKLHRHALGWDLFRAPFNIAVAVPQVAARLLAATGRKTKLTRPMAEKLARINLFLGTRVGREVGWLILTELLELPAEDGKGRISARDAFAEELMKDPRVQQQLQRAAELLEAHAGDEVFFGRLEEKLKVYTTTRAAAADIVTVMTMVGAGAAAAHKFTPGAMTLVPALSGAIAQKMAISSFPLGLGSLWYSAFPASASAGVLVGTAGTVLAVGSVLTAFAGVIADPVQRKLGLHRRRLNKLLDNLERELVGGVPERLELHDHYAARLLDLVDVVVLASRLAAR